MGRPLSSILSTVICLMAVCAALIAHAQITKTARLELTDEQPSVYLGENLYITQDPERRLSAEVVGTRHENNLRGDRQERNVINLGPGSTPSWLVFSVTNNSSTEDWVLDFGKILSGRMALAHELLVTNYTTKKVYTGAASANDDKGRGENIRGAAVPVKITAGRSELFVAYIEAEDGFPATIAPSLKTAQTYIDSLNFDAGTALMKIFFIAAITAFLTLAYVYKDITYILFAGYFGIHFILFLFIDELFFAKFSLTGVTLSFLSSVAMLWGIALSRLFLNITAEDYTENSILFAMACLIGITTLGSFIVLDKSTVLDEALVFVPHMLSIAVMCGLMLQPKIKTKPGAPYFIGGWAALLLGLIVATMSYVGPLSTNAFNVNLAWYALVPQAGLFIAASLRRIQMMQAEERSLIARESRAESSLARLKQSKESADQARLMRVIERERELMTELREREMLRTEEMRKAKEMADHANQAKSAFLAVVSHEIRTPMNGVMGILRLLKDTKMSKEQNDYLLAIQKSGDTMMALLNDILDFEKIETGNMELEKIDFDLPRLVQGVVTLMSGHAATKSITLKHDISENFPHSLVGDPTRLRQVLLNLVSNAVKFTDDGTVTIRLRAATPSNPGAKADYEIYIGVEDTGIGISDEAQERLFTPFQQANTSTARKYGGTGLGLAICQRLVEAMGSSVRITSTPGQGSTFFFSLLMAKGSSIDEEETEASTDQAARNVTPAMTLLVVDDNEINRKVVQNFLERDGHTIITADSGEDAVSLMQTHNFDGAFLDINLSGMSGLETAKTIRAMPSRKKAIMPLVALTGNTSEEDIAAIQQANFNDYLAKPIDFDRLLEMVADMYNGKYVTRQRTTPQPMTEAPPETTSELPASSFESKWDSKEPEAAPIQQFLQQMAGDEPDDHEDFDSFEMPEEIPPDEPVDTSVAIDEKTMKGLLNSLGKVQIHSLMQSFMETADNIIEALQKETDAINIRDRAHELKGMAANFGIKELAAIAAIMEAAAKENNIEAAQAEIPKLADANARAKAAIQQFINQGY